MNLKVYKVQFYADVGRLRIKTPIACSITGSWKRSAEVAKTTTVEFSNGEANFDQTIAIPVNMYYEENSYTFQEKKSLFAFTLHTPKGDKTAGTVTVDLASMLNNKLDCYEENYKLDKCPDKQAKVFIRIRAELIGEQNPDAMSHISGISANVSSSELSMLSLSKDIGPFASIGSQNQKAANSNQSEPAAITTITTSHLPQLELLRKQIQQQNSQKTILTQQLQAAKMAVGSIVIQEDGDDSLRNQVIKLNQQLNTLRIQLQKSKGIEQKLQKELAQARTYQKDHQQELSATRVRTEEVCGQLLKLLGSYL